MHSPFWSEVNGDGPTLRLLQNMENFIRNFPLKESLQKSFLVLSKNYLIKSLHLKNVAIKIHDELLH